MTPTVTAGRKKSEIALSPIYENTTITLRSVKNTDYASIFVYQNDQIIAWLNFPVMKVVRGIRKLFPNVKIVLI